MAKWIVLNQGDVDEFAECSECGFEVEEHEGVLTCPKCGSRMEGSVTAEQVDSGEVEL